MKLYTYIIILCIMIYFSFWFGVRHGLDQCIDCQAALKQTLQNQVNYIEDLNRAFNKTYEMAKEEMESAQ